MAVIFHVPGFLSPFYSDQVTYKEPTTYKTLRRALKNANLYRIEKDTGIPRATVRRFRDGSGDIYFRTAARLMDYLSFELKKKKRR